LLCGSGKRVRHLRLETETTLDEPAVRRAIAFALDLARVPLDPKRPRTLEIRAVSATQRPRRPQPKPPPKAVAAKRKGDRR
jgi:hypothetical protein